MEQLSVSGFQIWPCGSANADPGVFPVFCLLGPSPYLIFDWSRAWSTPVLPRLARAGWPSLI